MIFQANLLATQRSVLPLAGWTALCESVSVAGRFSAVVPTGHILLVVPHALLVVCPLMHVFAQRGHDHDYSPRTPHDEH
jgi:hypothetical protein